MRDPFPIPPPTWLMSAVKPWADALNLYSLPLHAHEVVFAALLYTVISTSVSPRVSTALFPDIYPKLSARTRLSWDVHVVSFVQSIVICALSLWVMWFDAERLQWRDSDEYAMRIWGYYGSGGLIQSFALGYFLWDLYMCTRYVNIFGLGMLAHAISAVSVFSLGYRPFVYYYAPVFLLYELSSPFLNIHWFCDKLNLTGSIYQAVNGGLLTLTFFCCRIVWGLYSSSRVFIDIYSAYALNQALPPKGRPTPFSVSRLQEIYADPNGQTFAFNSHRDLPLWLIAVYVVSNLVLNVLNIFWFGKMIETIRSRFDPPFGTRGTTAAPHKPYQTAREEEEEAEAAAKQDMLRRRQGGGEKDSLRDAMQRADAIVDGDSDAANGVTPQIGKGSVTRRTKRKA